MLGLITNRTQANVDRLNELNTKGWANMTPAEQAEWMGDPMTAPNGVNLIPNGPYYSGSVELTYRNEYIRATALMDGAYLYAVSIIGEAGYFEGKTLTLSVGAMTGMGQQLALYWHDDMGFDPAGIDLTPGNQSVSATLNRNVNGRQYLALYVYAATRMPAITGAVSDYHHVMLEFGDTRHDYVPYTPILATPATLGAYNYSDLNRVETVVEELSERWGLGLVTKTNWTMWEVPTEADMVRFKRNLDTIATERIGETVLTGISYDLSLMTYEDANRIEAFLMDVSSG